MRRGRQHGFSLPELMIVMVLMGVLVVGVMNAFTVQKKNASINDQVVDAQQTTRLLGDLLEEDIRHAGLLVPESAALCAIDNLNAPDVFYLSDAVAIDVTSESRSDLGARVDGATNVSSGSSTLSVDTLVLEANAPNAAYDTDGDGTPDSDFRVGSGVIVTDAGNPSRGTACGTVTAVAVTGPSLSITLESGPLAAVSSSADPVDLVFVPAHVYRVAGLQLLRNGAVIAGDVEDLQIALFVDGDQDRVVDVGEYRGDGIGAEFDPSATNVALVREVRANLVVRTRLEDLSNSNGRFQEAENRAGPTTADGYRRRTYSSTVMPRNVGTRAPT